MTFQGHTIFTSPNGAFRVGILTDGNQVAVSDANKYASEAAATLAAKKAHFDKPFLNFVVVRD